MALTTEEIRAFAELADLLGGVSDDGTHLPAPDAVRGADPGVCPRTLAHRGDSPPGR